MQAEILIQSGKMWLQVQQSQTVTHIEPNSTQLNSTQPKPTQRTSAHMKH